MDHFQLESLLSCYLAFIAIVPITHGPAIWDKQRGSLLSASRVSAFSLIDRIEISKFGRVTHRTGVCWWSRASLRIHRKYREADEGTVYTLYVTKVLNNKDFST